MTYSLRSLLGLSVALGLAPLAACGGSSSTNNGPDAADTTGGPPDLGTTPKTWTWMPITGTQCASGTETGIGVNLGTSSDLVIYLQGGGACFNSLTCASAANLGGFGQTEFNAQVPPYATGLFNRDDATNPLKDASFIFVPYCTGDVHAGANTNGIGGRKQVGYTNVGLDLDKLVAASTKVKRVILAGSSAGGFGALFNYDRTVQAFPGKPVYLIDDSGPPLSDTYITPCLQTQMRQYWNLAATLPADCTACTTGDGGGLGAAAGYLADKYPTNRLALISSTRDGVIRSFLGFGYPDCASGGGAMPEPAFAAGVAELRDTTLAGKANFKLFTKDSGLHVWLIGDGQPNGLLSDVTVGSSNLGTWLTQMLSDDAAWATVKP